MKIAICISQSSVGGVGTSTYILARGMRKAGHQADILATDGRLGPDYERARRDGWPVEAICIGERWLRRRMEITLNTLSTYDLVINNHSTETRLVLPALPAHVLRLSVIRSTDAPVIKEASHNCQHLDSLVGISPQVTLLLRQTGVSSYVNTIPNAVLIANDNLPTLSKPLRIVFIGRLEERQKNILILPDIAEILHSKGLYFKIIVIGDGPHRQDLEEKITRMNLWNIFDIRGAMNRDAAWDVLRDAHFSLIPSNFEGFGLVIAESMAAGAIPVVSAIPVFRWILGEDADTLSAPVKDTRTYAARIHMLAADPARYQKIQARLQQRQKDNFSPESTVSGYLRLIEKLRKTHDPNRFIPMPLAKLHLPHPYRRQCSRAWWILQKAKDSLKATLSNS